MKRMLVSLLTLMLFATATVPVFAQNEGQSRFGRKARTAAIIGGGAAAGALIGGKKGAAIGAGGATVYAMNRRAARENFKKRNRTLATVAGGTLAGAGVGAAVGGKKAATVGALAGAGGSYIYSRRSNRNRRQRYYRF